MFNNIVKFASVIFLLFLLTTRLAFSEIVKKIEIDGNERIPIETINMLSNVKINDNIVNFLKDWNNIFRPGFSNKQQGWGIGLSMVKRIVEDFLGGVVKVESSSEKNGTSMKLILPIISKR